MKKRLGNPGQKRVSANKKDSKQTLVQPDIAAEYLEIAAVIILALDKNGDITFINKKGCEVLGYRKNELLGKNWFNTCLPDRNRVLKVFKKTMSGKEKFTDSYENSVLKSDGSTRVVHWTNTLLVHGKKRIGTLSSGEDITERRENEIKLIQSEEKIRSIFNSGNDAIIIHNASGEITDSNERASKMWGCASKKIKFETLFSKDDKKNHDLVRKALKAALSGVPQVIEWSTVTSKNKKFWVEFSMKNAVIKGENVVISNARDITERRLTEAMARDSENRLRTILSSLVDIVYVFDNNGRFTYAHIPDQMEFIFNANDVLGKKHSNVMPPGADKLFADALNKTSKGESAEYEFCMVINNQKKWYSSKLSPVFDEKLFSGAVSVIRDITAWKKSEEEIKKRNIELERFNKFAIGREIKMIELKKKISKLERKLQE